MHSEVCCRFIVRASVSLLAPAQVILSKSHCFADLMVDAGPASASQAVASSQPAPGGGFTSAVLRFVELASVTADALQADPSFEALHTLLDVLATQSRGVDPTSSLASNTAATLALYDQSCLTQLLRASLNGFTSTAVLAVLHPADAGANAVAIDLADRCRRVTNVPRANTDVIPSLIQQVSPCLAFDSIEPVCWC